MINFLLIFVGIFVSALAQIMLKKAGNFEFMKDFNFFLFFLLGGGFYVISFGIYTYLLKIFDISKISPVMTIGTMLLVVLSGIVLFKEVLSIRQMIGVLFGIISIILIIK
jgi:drug/metabolite transporter (DMT)-like permease